jgi:nitrate reductase NapD
VASETGPSKRLKQENALDNLCVSSLVVQTQPAKLVSVRQTLEAIPEAEVFAENKLGKLVVVLDTPNNRNAADKISEIQNVAGVLSATLIYQYDDQFGLEQEDSA